MTPEITTPEKPSLPAMPSYVWAILAAATFFVYFYGLTLPFLGPDEARYAQVGREMLERGDWITPTLGGSTWFEKPAVLYWLEICSYKIFGVNEFAARFGPALFGLGTVASLWILGRFTSKTDNRQPTTDNFANWLALVAATTLGIMVFARGASFDIIITFPITAALVSFFIFDRASSQRHPVAIAPGSDSIAVSLPPYVPASRRLTASASLTLFYVFIGVALLAKGLIGIVFPLAIVGFYYVLSRRMPSVTLLLSVVWGTLIAVAVALIWYWPVYHQNGYQFIEEFFVEHHFQRFTSNKYQHPQPFYFFLWVLPLMTLPWLPFFLAAIWNFVKGTMGNPATEDTEIVSNEAHLSSISATPPFRVASSPLLLFATAWILVPLVFFSFSGSKLPGYILPSIPGAVLLTSVFIYRLVETSKRWRNAVLVIATTMLAATVVLLTFAVPRFAESDSVRSLIKAADDSGHFTERIISLHTISHNAEFYAAGRLLRDETGKQRRFSGVAEVIAEIEAKNDSSVLVLVPVEYVSQLTSSPKMTTMVIKDNGELAIVAVSLK